MQQTRAPHQPVTRLVAGGAIEHPKHEAVVRRLHSHVEHLVEERVGRLAGRASAVYLARGGVHHCG